MASNTLTLNNSCPFGESAPISNPNVAQTATNAPVTLGDKVGDVVGPCVCCVVGLNVGDVVRSIVGDEDGWMNVGVAEGDDVVGD